MDTDSRKLPLWQEALDELVACGLVEELFITGDPEPRYQISASMTAQRPYESSHSTFSSHAICQEGPEPHITGAADIAQRRARASRDDRAAHRDDE